MYGTLALSLEDNPANSTLGGFKEGSTAHRYCCSQILCMIYLKEFFKLKLRFFCNIQLRRNFPH